MAASRTWLEWLAGVWNSLLRPAGSPGAWNEEERVAALLEVERAKPPGQRDEARVRQLEVQHGKLQLENVQVRQGSRGGRGGGSQPPLAAATGGSGGGCSERALPELVRHAPSCRCGA